MRSQDEVKEIMADIRRNLITAVNKCDIVSYMYFSQELVIGIDFLESDKDRKEANIFLMLLQKTFNEMRAINE